MTFHFNLLVVASAPLPHTAITVSKFHQTPSKTECWENVEQMLKDMMDGWIEWRWLIATHQQISYSCCELKLCHIIWGWCVDYCAAWVLYGESLPHCMLLSSVLTNMEATESLILLCRTPCCDISFQVYMLRLLGAVRPLSKFTRLFFPTQ